MNLELMKYWNFRKFHHFLVKNAKFQIRIVCHMCAFQKFIYTFHDLQMPSFRNLKTLSFIAFFASSGSKITIFGQNPAYSVILLESQKTPKIQNLKFSKYVPYGCNSKKNLDLKTPTCVLLETKKIFCLQYFYASSRSKPIFRDFALF